MNIRNAHMNDCYSQVDRSIQDETTTYKKGAGGGEGDEAGNEARE